MEPPTMEELAEQVEEAMNWVNRELRLLAAGGPQEGLRLLPPARLRRLPPEAGQVAGALLLLIA